MVLQYNITISDKITPAVRNVTDRHKVISAVYLLPTGAHYPDSDSFFTGISTIFPSKHN
jgi:hypothetical protein